MKQLIRLLALSLLLLTALVACSSSKPEIVRNPDAPLVQVYHPPT